MTGVRTLPHVSSPDYTRGSCHVEDMSFRGYTQGKPLSCTLDQRCDSGHRVTSVIHLSFGSEGRDTRRCRMRSGPSRGPILSVSSVGWGSTRKGNITETQKDITSRISVDCREDDGGDVAKTETTGI